MLTNPVGPCSSVWASVTQTLSEAVPLPLWRPAGAKESGHQAVEVPVDESRMRQAWQALDSTTVLASWGIVASRHLQTNNIVFGLLECGDGNGRHEVWPQLLRVEPEQSVHEYCASVQRNGNLTLGIPDAMQLLGWPSDKLFLDTLIAVAKDTTSVQPPNRALGFWTNAMSRHRCSLMLIVQVSPVVPLIQLVFDQTVYSTDGIQQLGEQLVVVLGALMAMQGNEWAIKPCIRVADVPWLSQRRSYVGHSTGQPESATVGFWRALLHGVILTPDLQLPSTRLSSQHTIAEPYVTHTHTLGCPLSNIHAFCQSLDITTSSLLRGLWALLLHRYLSYPAEVTFGVLASRRSVLLADIDNTAGMCINLVPFRVKFDSEQPLHNWLRYIHRVSGEIMAHEHASLVDIQQWANAPVDTSLFQSLLVYDKHCENQLELDNQGMGMRPLDGFNFTKYSLTASFYNNDKNLCVSLVYRTDKYDDAYASLLCACLDACLSSIISSTPDTVLERIQQLPDSEYETIMRWSHGIAKSLDPTCALLPDLFTNSLHRCPQAIALESGDKRWTYAQVHQQAMIIAQWLIAHHVQPGDRVALVFTRSPYFVFAVLAVLLVGGIYVPIDAAIPIERIRGILSDLQKPLILLEDHDEVLVHHLTPVASGIGYCNTMASCSINDSIDTASVYQHPQDLAYIIFTSGTTGKPKGVPNRHESIVNTVLSMCQMLRATRLTRFAQLLNISFDGCVAEIFIAFCLGITLVLRSDDILHTLKQVDSSHIMPSLLSALDPADYPNLRMIITCGEALPDALAQQWCGHCALFNFYGPSECAVGTHGARVVGNECLTIGTAFPNLQTYILDDTRSISPIGVPGEICIAGIGVSNGYHNRPDLTAKAFIDNPFGPGKLYLTGDLGCWLPNGKIKHLGRKDFQVKLRGFRIELGEVEQVILRHPSVTATCAVAQDDNLVAFVAPSTCDPQSIQQLISQSLPPYMVPAVIVPLAALPLTRIGKVDRKALPRVDFDKLHHQDIMRPQTAMETALVGMLAKIMGLNEDQISTGSTFFQLGGNSLTAIRLVAKCQRQGFVLAMADINHTHTIAQLAKLMESQNAIADREPYPTVSGPVRLTPIQCEFLSEGYQWPQAYQSPLLLQCSTIYADSTWQHVVTQLLSHHDMLRFHLAEECDSSGAPMGVIEPALDTSQVLAFCEVATEADLHAVAFEASSKVDHHAGPVCQFRVVTMQEQQLQFLLLLVHHLAFDLVSCIVLVDDVASLLQNQTLTPKTLSYVAWSDTMYAMAQDLDVSTIALPTPSPPLPLDYPHVPLNRSKEYEAKEVLTIDHELLRRFNTYTQEHTVAAVDLLMTALLLACNQHFNTPSITVAFESNGRSLPGQSCDVSRTLGWCVSHHYLSLTKQPHESPKATLERTQSALRDLPVNGFNLFLAKHLKSFSKPHERAQFNINPELAFGYSDCKIAESAADALPIKPSLDLLAPIMPELLPNAHPYPLVVSCAHAMDKLDIRFIYHTNQFRPSTIQQLALDFKQVLDSMA